MTTVSTTTLACDMCGGQMALVTQTKTETLWNCWECKNPVRETPMITFREYSELTTEERDDGIEAAVMWLKFSFPLLLPCDISEACRVRIVSEAAKVHQKRETALDKAWREYGPAPMEWGEA